MPRLPSASTRSMQAFFRAKAASWGRNYNDGGEMAGRIAQFTAELSARLPKGGTVLDFGCGSGNIALHLAREGWQVTGCDVTAEMIDAARAADAEGLVQWVLVEPTGVLPFGPGQFDAVVASSVLEYVDRPGETVAALTARLRPGGIFLASVPDPRHPVRRREEWHRLALRLPGLAAILRGTRWAEGMHYLMISRNRFAIMRWTDLLSRAGLTVEPVTACSGTLAMLCARKA